MFLEQFVKYKDANNVALICGEVSLTYAELYIRCTALASNLRSRGVGLGSTLPEDYDIFHPKAAKHSPWVIIISERSVNAVIGIIATWMAGGAFVLVDAQTHYAVIRDIIADTAVSVILKDDDNFIATKTPDDFQIKFPLKNEIACALYTSGTTGKPKGVVIEHRAFNVMLKWLLGYITIRGSTATASYASLGSAVALTELFFPLINGLTLHILDESTRHDLFALENYIEKHNISFLFLPPDAAEVFTQQYKGKALKFLYITGGRLKSCDKPDGYEIMYHLDMSENIGGVTFKSIFKAMDSDIPIGNPCYQTKVRLDESTGEIIVSGPTLFRGYLSRPDETAKYLRNGEFYSGDIGRIDENGEFFYVGKMEREVDVHDTKENPVGIAVLFERVLGRVAGEDDDFLALGGNSLKLMHLQEEIAKEFLQSIPYTVLFNNLTPRKINDLIQKQSGRFVEPIPAAPPMEMYPLSGPMRQMWLAWRTGQDKGKYNVVIKSRFTGKIDKSRVLDCIKELTCRNSILRSRFVGRDGNFFQVIDESIEFSINDEPYLEEFDLTKAPLFDISLNANTLTLTAHHIIADAVGMQIMMEDFWTLYTGGDIPESAQVQDITLWLKEKTPNYDYWVSLYSDGIPEVNLPYDFDRPKFLSIFGREKLFFDRKTAARFREFCVKQSTTIFQMFLTAYALLLSKISGCESLVIGVSLAGRDHPQLKRTIGMLAKTLPIRLDISSEMNFEAALKYTTGCFGEAWEHQDIHIDHLIKLLKLKRTPGNNPLFGMMLNYRLPLRPLPDADELQPKIIIGEYMGVATELMLDIIEDESGITMFSNYADLFLPETVKSWVNTFESILKEIE